MPVKIVNNASARLASPISASDTSITLGTGASSFPALGAGEWCPATIVKSDGQFEIVRVTARSGSVLTVVRGQEGTSPKPFAFGDRIEIRLTTGTLQQLINDPINQLEASLGTAASRDADSFWSKSESLGSTDLNTLGSTSHEGCYRQTSNASATPELGYPVAKAGTLLVTGAAYGCLQIYIPFDSGSIFVRGLTASFNGNGPWRAWNEIGKTDSLAWASITGKPDQATRWPAWGEVTGKPATFAPTIGTTATTAKAGDYVPAWSEITGKPSTFAPSSHTHAWSNITGAPAQATRWPTWSEVTGKPSTFPAAAPTAAQVGAATAGLTNTSVGAYSVLRRYNYQANPGTNHAGSTFNPSASGTFKIMGLANTVSSGGDYSDTSYYYLVLRVA